MGIYGLLTELNLDSVPNDANAPEALGVRPLAIKELHNNSPLITREGSADESQTKTYTDVLPVGDPDVRDSPDVHHPRSGDVRSNIRNGKAQARSQREPKKKGGRGGARVRRTRGLMPSEASFERAAAAAARASQPSASSSPSR